VNAAVRLTGFAAAVAVLAAGAALAGAALEPRGADGGGDATPGTGHGHAGAESAAAAASLPGLAVSDGGLTLRLASTTAPPGRPAELRFRITDAAGRAVTAYDLRHERRMHVIVVRRDGTGFAHVHPRMSPSGDWTVRTRIARPGTHRVFADFSTGGRDVTLGADLAVDGTATHRPLPAAAPTAGAGDGVVVRLRGAARAAGAEQTLRFAVTRDGVPVATQPYLGAGGHLVALREGDLAYLHTHPAGHDEDTGAPEDVEFRTTFPSAGRYRLYLQFRLDGRVRTAEFTREVTP
jgi:hypothetical protein